MKKPLLFVLLFACLSSIHLSTAAQEEVNQNMVECARNDLAKEKKVAKDRVEVRSVTRKTFPNGCLDAAQEGEMCTQALTPGHQILLFVNGEKDSPNYEYRTNGRQLRRVEGESRGRRISCQ
ncbi:MAG: hypothetical protein AB1489_03880 [Acidobacteriota bacterium]